MNGITSFFSKHWMHFAVIAVFFVIARMYFAPQFDDYGLKQHDVEQFKGMSNEIVHFREETGQEPLWTNSMFGGMPATQISIVYGGNVFKSVTNGFLKTFPSPVGIFLLHLIGFYIFGLFLRLKPLVILIGAIAFAFASYEIVILQAGHNSKALAVAFLPAVLGAFIYAFQRNWKWGAVLSAVMMGFELAMNHYQVTYYLAFLLVGLGIYFAIEAIRKKQFKQFGFAAGGVLAGYMIAIMINYGSISMTNDYADATIRGTNDLTTAPDGGKTKATVGLDREYITNWSYGIDESFTFVSPYIKGSHNSKAIAESNFADMVEEGDYSSEERNLILNRPLYWGEQAITSGPVYLGVLTVFLALLGMVFLKDRIKWVYLAVSILALMLSWGKHFMGLTDFFIENVPLYASFRTVTIILVLLELTIPVIAVMLLQKLWVEREAMKVEGKKFLIVSGVFFVFLLGLKMVGLDSTYASKSEIEMNDEEAMANNIMGQLSQIPPQQLKEQYGVDVSNPDQVKQFVDLQVADSMKGFDAIRKFRADVFSSSTTRSLVIAFFAIGLMALFFYTSIPSLAIVGGLTILMLADLIPVNTNYIGSKEVRDGKYVHWTPTPENVYPMTATPGDYQILENEVAQNPRLRGIVDAGARKGINKARELEYERKYQTRVEDAYKFAALNANTNYRVFELDGGFGSSRASYFHKSLGGYHGAKLRSIQNLIEFHIQSMNEKVLDMLNVKYMMQQGQVTPRASALGNAWLVSEVKEFANSDDEIRALGAKFKLVNNADGQFLVNGEVKSTATVFGSEKLQYVPAKSNVAMGQPQTDTLEVKLTNGLQVGQSAAFVVDQNGVSELMPLQVVENDTTKSFKNLVTITLTDRFEPAKEVTMLAADAKKLSSKKFSQEGKVTMTKYAPNQIKYSADVEGTQFVVFSEMYYSDGWKAFVNGKEQEIIKVDYALRGLELAGGKHTIEFKYDLPKFHKAENYAMIGSVLILIWLGLVLFLDWRGKKIVPEQED